MFQNLQKALLTYAGGGKEGDSGGAPIEDKQALVTVLEAALNDARAFVGPLGGDVDAIIRPSKRWSALMNGAVSSCASLGALPRLTKPCCRTNAPRPTSNR